MYKWVTVYGAIFTAVLCCLGASAVPGSGTGAGRENRSNGTFNERTGGSASARSVGRGLDLVPQQIVPGGRPRRWATYAEPKLPVVERSIGKVRDGKVFLEVLAASKRTFLVLIWMPAAGLGTAALSLIGTRRRNSAR